MLFQILEFKGEIDSGCLADDWGVAGLIINWGRENCLYHPWRKELGQEKRRKNWISKWLDSVVPNLRYCEFNYALPDLSMTLRKQIRLGYCACPYAGHRSASRTTFTTLESNDLDN